MALKIRPAKVTDVPVLVKLERACFPPRGTGWGKAGFTKYIVKKYGTSIVLVDGTVVVGFAIFSGNRLNVIGVDPERQRQGLSSQLLENVIARLKKTGWSDMELDVQVANKGALAFYRKHKFKSRGTVEHWTLGKQRQLARSI